MYIMILVLSEGQVPGPMSKTVNDKRLLSKVANYTLLSVTLHANITFEILYFRQDLKKMGKTSSDYFQP